MIKLTLRTAAFLVAVSTPAMASSQVWNVTEEGLTGVKSSQGTWAVTIDGNNKLSGSANMQFDNGSALAYNIDGSIAESVYTMNIVKRTDGKNGCVWSGHSPAHADEKSHGLIGEVKCDGNVRFMIRAGF
ncbi:MAG: hypothetical protein WA733_02240 [Methylocystis sp.]|jgi:hypothetical protein